MDATRVSSSDKWAKIELNDECSNLDPMSEISMLLLLLELVSASGYLAEIEERYKMKPEILHSFREPPRSPFVLIPLLGLVLTLVVPLFMLGKASKSLQLLSLRVSLLLALCGAFFVFTAFFVSWRLPETTLALLPVFLGGYLSLRDLQ